MAVLGKRKASEPAADNADVSEIFRRHFEAQFKPLAAATKASATEVDRTAIDEQDEEGDGEEEEWGGLSEATGSDNDEEYDNEDSEEEDGQTVEVVDHSVSQTSKAAIMSKHELKAFMSSRPPDQTTISKALQPAAANPSDLPEDAPSLLAQDLELRRLISESHLLAPNSHSSAQNAKPFAEGRTRLKATDLRVQALGSKASVLAQEKMPMHMRKGINAAAGAREAKRRRQARENGIILERESGGKKKTRKRRGDVAVDRPGVGRMKGAELRISERDVQKIEGGRDTFGRRSRR